MPLDDATLDHLAELARLDLPAEARAALRHDLARLLSYLAHLQRVDVEGVVPLTRPFGDDAPDAGRDAPPTGRPDALDPDRAVVSEQLEALAPAWREGRVRVARTVDEAG